MTQSRSELNETKLVFTIRLELWSALITESQLGCRSLYKRFLKIQ